MSHCDQMQDVQVVVGSADCRWLQVNSLLLVQRRYRQYQCHLEKHTKKVTSIKMQIRNISTQKRH